MYAGVPIAIPAPVSEASVGFERSRARAMPKSATTACPPDSMMFSGFTSRCTIPWPWA